MTDKITIPGFISFEQTFRSARQGRNPQTGETIQVAATNTVKVSAGAKLKAIAAGKEPAPTLITGSDPSPAQIDRPRAPSPGTVRGRSSVLARCPHGSQHR